MKLLRTASLLAVLVALLAAVTASAAAKKPTLKLGPNLVVNPSFEQSTVEPATANALPVLPVGWTFEGATILFDYNARGGHTGPRNAAISGSLAPGRQICDASAALATGGFTCVPNPAAGPSHQATEAALSTWSLRPFWVSEKAITVKPGVGYRFSMWSIRPSLAGDVGVMGEGPISKVRWLNAAGSTIGVVDATAALKGTKRELGFRQTTATLTAPAGAAGAKILLGHSDYTVTSPVAFDDISLQLIIRR